MASITPFITDEARLATSPIPGFDWMSSGMRAYYVTSIIAMPIVLIALAIAFQRHNFAWGMTILMFSIIPPFNLLAGIWFALAYLSILMLQKLSTYLSEGQLGPLN
jgi:hypothetical protein